ncbi:MAG: glycosyltransferase, partial [Endomicrobium sp.]|nr:glycosyltransferase [Endomicrobium sp.]
MDSPKISTIIPVYNVERYLTHSLDSIANQTYKNLEIICIDDGSSDNSRTILEEYAKKDSRINVIKQENTGGLGYYARNAGLKIAKGDYLSFADPDDYIDLDFYEKLIAAALKTKADIVCAATRWLDVQGKVTRITLGTADSDNVKKDFAKILSSLQHGAVWNKLYARDLIFKNNLYFHGYCGEDNFFTISALYHCNKISSVKDAYYNYRQSNPLSAGNNPAQKAANERIEGVFFVAQETLDFIGAKFAG